MRDLFAEHPTSKRRDRGATRGGTDGPRRGRVPGTYQLDLEELIGIVKGSRTPHERHWTKHHELVFQSLAYGEPIYAKALELLAGARGHTTRTSACSSNGLCVSDPRQNTTAGRCRGLGLTTLIKSV